MPRASGRDIAEIFGHAPDDRSTAARGFWDSHRCPFVNRPCTKTNHDQTIVYGVCSVKNQNGDEVITCPNRLYANNYALIQAIAEDMFGSGIPFYTYGAFMACRAHRGRCIVALGAGSGKEVSLGKQLSIDWVLALLDDGRLCDFGGLEVQSMDITGNYRSTWQAYAQLGQRQHAIIPESEHGINWANVHKRLIPQLIRKGAVFAKSTLCSKGLHFALPDLVYKKFEEVVGALAPCERLAADVLTVHTCALGPVVSAGSIRSLVPVQKRRVLLTDFAAGFVTGPNLPSGAELDAAISRSLGIH